MSSARRERRRSLFIPFKRRWTRSPGSIFFRPAQWSFRAGRQELSYGDERLVGAFGWDNLGRSFDAARLRYRTGAWVNDFFWSRLVDVRRGGAPHRPGNRDLYGNYLTWAPQESPGRTEF